MKQLTYILLLAMLTLWGCNNGHSDCEGPDGKHLPDPEPTPITVDGDFAMYEYDLSMYNLPYLIRITPFVDSSSMAYQSGILLIQKQDTVFSKLINIDSLQSTIYKHEIFKDSTYYDRISSDFELRRITYRSVRTNDLYFVADLGSKVGDDSFSVLFQLSYLNEGEIGKLFVNGFSTNDYKKNWMSPNNGTMRRVEVE